MNINGVNDSLAHEATIVILKGTDGMFYAQSGSLCKGETAELAVRRCARCLSDYAFAKKYDMYQNGEIKSESAPCDHDRNQAYNDLLKRCA